MLQSLLKFIGDPGNRFVVKVSHNKIYPNVYNIILTKFVLFLQIILKKLSSETNMKLNWNSNIVYKIYTTSFYLRFN